MLYFKFNIIPASIVVLITTTIFQPATFAQIPGGETQLNLIEPKDTGNNKPTTEDFAHSVQLLQGKVILTLNGKVYKTSYQALDNLIKTNHSQIIKKYFSIIICDDISYNDIVYVLDLMSIHKVKKCNLLNLPKVKTPPKSVQPALQVNDSTAFNIIIEADGYVVQLLKDSQRLNDTTSLNRYIIQNKVLIKEATIKAPGKTSYPSVKRVIDVLKRNDIYNFSLLVIPD